MRIPCFVVVLALSVGCVWVNDAEWQARVDVDGDGVFAINVGGTDCDDSNPQVRPDAVEVCNGVDDDCDGNVDGGLVRLRYLRDADEDGFGDPEQENISCTEPDGYVQTDSGAPEDCNDARAEVFPGAPDVWYDGIDSNCDGEDDFDQDGDGYANAASGGGDCDDLDPARSPAAEERWYDDVDQNCDGADDFDQDGDGHRSDAHGGDDCNDVKAGVHPGATEIWYDGVDQDCRNDDDYDQDGDGAANAQGFGEDCNDTDATIFPDAEEIWYDGIDQDCDEADDFDRDGDGFASDAYGGTDCDDTTVNVGPGEGETCNERDDDCNGLVDDIDTYWRDADGDGAGLPSEVVLGCELPDGYVAEGNTLTADCDDDDPLTYPGAPVVCGDWVDNDCGTDPELCIEVSPIWPNIDLSGTSFGSEFGSTGDFTGDGVVDLWIGGLGGGSNQQAARPRLVGFRGPFPDGGWGEEEWRVAGAPVDDDQPLSMFPVNFGTRLEGQVLMFLAPMLTQYEGEPGDSGYLWLVEPTDIGSGEHDLSDVAAQVLELPTGLDAFQRAWPLPSASDPALWFGQDRAERFGIVRGFPSSARPIDDAEVTGHWDTSTQSYLTAVDLADMDGDGADDLLLGSGWYHGLFDGAIILNLGPLPSYLDAPSQQDARLDDPRGNDAVGANFCTLDFDGDGRLEVADGGQDGPRVDTRAYVGSFEVGVPHPLDTMANISLPFDDQARKIHITCPGDMNGDGIDDLALGTAFHNNYGGFAAVVFGPPSQHTLDLASNPELADLVVVGNASSISGIGNYSARVGDVDGDGRDDLLMGERAATGGVSALWLFRSTPD